MCKPRFAWGALAALMTVAVPAVELLDPMQPPAAPAAPAEAAPEPERAVWRVRAIKIEAHRRSAMINGQMVTEGDEIDGARVLQIKPRTVVIEVGNKTTSLSLLNHEIKRHPTIPR